MERLKEEFYETENQILKMAYQVRNEVGQYFKENALNNHNNDQPQQKIVPSQDYIERFIIAPSNPPKQPFFKKLNEKNSASDLFISLNKFVDNLQTSISNEIKDVREMYEDENFFEIISMISRLIQRFKKTVKVRGEKLRLNKIEISAAHEELYNFLQKILEDKLIKRVMPVIYDGMKHDQEGIYELLLEKINKFLSDLGVHTVQIKAGEEMNYEFCTPIDSDDNITHNQELKDIIKEVRQLPYIFDEQHIVSEGQVVVWRYISE